MAASLPNSARWMPSADWLGSLARFSNESNTRKAAPAFGALVKVAPEKPTMFIAPITPGVFSAVSTMRRCTASVRDSAAPGGNWATTIR